MSISKIKVNNTEHELYARYDGNGNQIDATYALQENLLDLANTFDTVMAEFIGILYNGDLTDDLSQLPAIRTIAEDEASKVKDELLNGAGDAYDTLQELAELILADQSTIQALETIATNKVDKTTTVNGKSLSSDITITKSDLSLDNVENKSSATIREEITKDNIESALGFSVLTQEDIQAMIDTAIGDAISTSY